MFSSDRSRSHGLPLSRCLLQVRMRGDPHRVMAGRLNGHGWMVVWSLSRAFLPGSSRMTLIDCCLACECNSVEMRMQRVCSVPSLFQKANE